MRLSAKCAVLVALLLLGWLPLLAAERTVQVCVRDQHGDAIVGAQVRVQTDPARTVVTDASGCVQVSVEAGAQAKVEVERTGFSSVVQAIGDGSELTVVLVVKGATEEVQVTADRKSVV